MGAKNEAIVQAVQAAPPAVPVSIHLLGYPVADIAWALTAVYVVLQVFLILPKLYREYFKRGADA